MSTKATENEEQLRADNNKPFGIGQLTYQNTLPNNPYKINPWRTEGIISEVATRLRNANSWMWVKLKLRR